MKLNPQAKSPILCLIGPPGVGKTSLLMLDKTDNLVTIFEGTRLLLSI